METEMSKRYNAAAMLAINAATNALKSEVDPAVEIYEMTRTDLRVDERHLNVTLKGSYTLGGVGQWDFTCKLVLRRGGFSRNDWFVASKELKWSTGGQEHKRILEESGSHWHLMLPQDCVNPIGQTSE
jgi:hypothetical protein